MNPDAADLGFAHFIAPERRLGKTLLVILVVMSVASWAIIAIKGLTLVLRKRPQPRVPRTSSGTRRRSTPSPARSRTHGARDPFSHLTSHAMQAQAHHARYGAAKLEEAGTLERVRHPHDQEGARRGDGAARERPDRARHGRRDRAVRRPVRHRLGRLPRAGRDRHERRRARSTRSPARSARR